jgi:delta 1-pyrroline-5-carboxylate dehydrogenase
MISLILPAIAMGNRVVVVPSPVQPLSATDFYQVLDTSDVPGGVVSIVTGARAELAKTLADHDEVDAVRHEARPRAEALATQPLDTIALNRVADLLRHHDAKALAAGPARRRGSARCDEQDEMG